MPDIRGRDARFFQEIGAPGKLRWAKSNGMGIQPLDWTDVDPFARHNPHLQRWELSHLVSMSEAYVSGLRLTEPNTKAPVYARAKDDPGLADERRALSETLLAAFRAKKKRGAP